MLVAYVLFVLLVALALLKCLKLFHDCSSCLRMHQQLWVVRFRQYQIKHGFCAKSNVCSSCITCSLCNVCSVCSLNHDESFIQTTAFAEFSLLFT